MLVELVEFPVELSPPPYHSSALGNGLSTERLPVSIFGGKDGESITLGELLRLVGPANADSVPEVIPVPLDVAAALED